ncbi:MAG: acyltransferase [Dechloromonas sp.]|nr:acyltransferase [Dechloromonas sp.]
MRALAILSVMLFHAFPNLLRGGFVGVDVFFVISGFLISRIVFTGLARGSFSFVNFYVHRTRRIFPAMIVVLVCALGLGWLAMLAGEYRMLGKHVAGGIGFIANILLWGEDSYFGTASELKPLMHLWSLGIEEQFYLFFPVFLVVLWRFRFCLWLAMAVLMALSFWANLLWMNTDAAGAFFLPHTRVWELLAGGLLAYGNVFRVEWWLSPNRGVPLLSLVQNTELRSSLGLILLAAGLLIINKGSNFPGYWALLPVAGASLVIAAGPRAWVNRHLFANRGMVFVGLISYPLYLWHWPILSFLRLLEGRVPSIPVRIGALALTFVLAWLTYRYVERPLRFGGAVRTKAAGLLVAGLLLGIAGIAIYRLDGLPGRDVEQQFGTYQQEVGHRLYFEEMAKFPPCNLLGTSGVRDCWQTGAGAQKKTVAIIGDSHGADIFIGLAAHLPESENLAYFQVVCYPFVGITGNDTCPAVVPAVDYILADKDIRTVILSNYWAMRLRDKKIRFERELDNRNRTDIYEKLLALTLDRLIGAGKEVVFAVDIPDLDFPPEACLPSRPLAITQRVPGKDCLIPRANVEGRAHTYLAATQRVLVNYPQVRLWDPYPRLCSDTDCLVVSEGTLFYRDDNHLSPQAARWLFQYLWRTVEPNAKPSR